MKRPVIYLFVAIAVLVVLGLGYRYFAPFGKVVSYQFAAKLPGAKEATTYFSESGGVFKIATQILRTEQVRFAINAPTASPGQMTATLKFRKAPREIKLGARGNEKDTFIYRPLYNSVLENLDWGKIQDGTLTLWQKSRKYSSLAEFVNLANGQKIASYFVDANKLLPFIHSSEENPGDLILNTRLRGNHTLFVKVSRSPLVLTVAKQDINAYVGADELKVSVLKGDSVLTEKVIPDDGITDSSQARAEPQEEQLTVGNLEPGVYKINLAYQGVGLDTEITKIKVNQKGLVFKDFLAVVGTKPTTVWTSAPKITVATAHDEGVQTIKLDGIKDLQVKEKNKLFSFDLNQMSGKELGSLYVLSIPSNDIGITGEGYYSLTEGSYFDPEMLRRTDVTSLSDVTNVDYILASYRPARKDGDWMIVETVFDPNNLKLDSNKKYYFSLEMPDIAKYGGELEIDSFEVRMASKNAADSLLITGKGPSDNGIFTRIQRWLIGLKNKVFGAPPGPKPSIPVPSAPKPLAQVVPSSPSGQVKKIILPTVRVLNGGAPTGMAGKFVETLKEAGFANSTAGNADNLQYKNAIVKFRPADATAADKVITLLIKDYVAPIREVSATSSAEIIVILGSK